jgi:hypothetical protein
MACWPKRPRRSNLLLVFHVQLRQRRNTASVYNLSQEEVRDRFVTLMVADRVFDFAEKQWNPRETRLTVLEGRQLRPDELGFGRGWPNAKRTGTDVTDLFLSDGRVRGPQSDPVMRLEDRIAGRLAAAPLPLRELLAMTAELMPGHTVGERLAVCERTVWELLQRGGRGLQLDGAPLTADAWQAQLLDTDTWLGDRVSLTSG